MARRTCHGRVATGSTRAPGPCRTSAARGSAGRSCSRPMRSASSITLAPFGTRLGAAGRDACSRATGRATPICSPSAAAHSAIISRATTATAITGSGDKTGRLDLHGRRLRITMQDCAGLRSGTRRSALQALAVPHRARRRLRRVCGIFYDNAARQPPSISAASTTITTASSRLWRPLDGDLDLYVFPGPRSMRDAEIPRLSPAGTALPPRWTLGFAQTAMAIADSRRRAERGFEEFIAALRE